MERHQSRPAPATAITTPESLLPECLRRMTAFTVAWPLSWRQHCLTRRRDGEAATPPPLSRALPLTSPRDSSGECQKSPAISFLFLSAVLCCCFPIPHPLFGLRNLQDLDHHPHQSIQSNIQPSPSKLVLFATVNWTPSPWTTSTSKSSTSGACPPAP